MPISSASFQAANRIIFESRIQPDTSHIEQAGTDHKDSLEHPTVLTIPYERLVRLTQSKGQGDILTASDLQNVRIQNICWVYRRNPADFLPGCGGSLEDIAAEREAENRARDERPLAALAGEFDPIEEARVAIDTHNNLFLIYVPKSATP